MLSGYISREQEGRLPSRALVALRRNRVLLLAGGAVLTLALLVACALQIWATVNSYMSSTKEEMWSAAQRSERAMSRFTATLQEFAGVWAAQAEYLPLDADIVHARLADFAGDMFGSMERSVYVLDSHLQPLVVSHVPGTQLSAAQVLIPDLVGDSSAFQNVIRPYFLKPLNTHSSIQGGVATHWLPPHTSSVTGKQVVSVMRVVSGFNGDILGAVVVELPLATLASLIRWDKPYGGYLLMAPAGDVVLSSSTHAYSEVERLAREALTHGDVGSRLYSDYQNGFLVSAMTLAPTSWGLFYYFPREGIIDGVWAPITVSMVTTGLIVGVLWLLLFLIRRRISAPAILQSQLIFDSEELSRVLVEASPVGFGLISLKTRKPLLCSAQMQSVDANALIPGGNLSSEFCTRFLQHEAYGKHGIRRSYSVDLSVATRQGDPITLAVMIVRVRYKGEGALLVMFTDITMSKHAEQALNDARRSADAANAAKSAFLAAMSHEIRTPLNAIQGNLELLAHSKLDPVQRDRLAVISGASEDVVSTVNDVLDFSKIEAGELHLEESVFDANDVAVRALLVFAPVARNKGISLRSDFGHRPRQLIRGDPTRFAQVLNNLLSNALKFTVSGSVLLSLDVDTETGHFIVIVSDTGIGISAEQMSALFCAFSQADKTIHRRFGGTGLGLALCERLVSAMGGSLTATSQPGIGSRFMVRIPLNVALLNDSTPQFSNKKVTVFTDVDEVDVAETLNVWGLRAEKFVQESAPHHDQGSVADIVVLWGECKGLHASNVSQLAVNAEWVIECRPDGPSRPMISGRLISVSMYGLQGLLQALEFALLKRVPSSRGQSYHTLERRLRVMLVEDHPVTRRLLEEQLTLIGCDVRAVSDGAEALTLMEASPCEVLITDLVMPTMSGYELVKRAHESWPWMPVLVLTADLTLQNIRSFAHDAHTKVVGKPISLRKLGFAISEVSGVKAVRAKAESDTSVSRNKPLSDELLKIFQTSNDQSITVLRQGWLDKDVPRMLAELHAVRGALSVFGLTYLAQQSAVLSDALKARSMEECYSDFERFCFALRLALDVPKSGRVNISH